MDFLLQPWPWYITGPLIAITMLFLILFGKTFGMSSNLRTLCTISGADKYADFFKFDWKSQRWNLTVVLGAIIGGFIATQFLSNGTPIALSEATITDLQAFGFTNIGEKLVPDEIYSWDSILTLKGLAIIIVAGFLVGFGTRYAGGCTSGHAISGLSNLQLPSLIAVIGFFIGGLIMTHFILPLIF
ncbi:YeeE/YedE family protein [Cellulophaga baltica]|uniref:YeeE/YedE family protein n=1 Tax=Cellulophaga TaxID=104264 RepID=UPI001C07928C|nr:MULTISPECIES: YeeE/YedE thiosulfate transporter family protein [Cellulophaga]MBU2996930.1 YeeE/YedE family protein [Cellulophaga baltica]MDO6768328.1 YeeE/YedE thiosulfate transporter family protein [Cellulophaga sp. 1_MG-2023]